MITNTQSKGYELAKMAVEITKIKNSRLAGIKFLMREVNNYKLKRWEILAISDTFNALLKSS